MRIAVLLATYNRREKTLACLGRLQEQTLPEGVDIEIFLTDDNSSDGTSALVRCNYPAVNVFHGSGYLFWAGGMRHTWKRALLKGADYYLLLNDDTMLYTDALEKLLTIVKLHPSSICAGSTRDSISGALSYGGWKLSYPRQIWRSKKVFSETISCPIDFANANIMLVPAEVVRRIGILSNHFTHSLADYDYCLKAKRHGFRIMLAPGFLGECTDDHGQNWKSADSSLKERLQYLKSPKGLAYKEHMHFIADHFPLSYPAAFCKLWMKTIFPFIWDVFKKGTITKKQYR